MDQEDLYVYETNPARPDEYRYKGRWEPMETISERIEVRGEAPRTVTVAFTRHGPVLATDPTGHRAFALRAAWLETGMAPYFGAIEYMRARNWDQFAAAMNRWGAPGENQVYADTSGNIGWIPAGLTVVRPNWDGLTPVPGDGRYEWAGYRDMDELPRAFNPASGYVITANENNIPPDHPAAAKGVGYEWSDDSRARRLQQLFASRAPHRLEDSRALQLDTTSLPAQRLVRLLAGVTDARPDVSRALDLLRRWDGNVRADSAAAAVFEVWFTNHLRRSVVQAVLPPAAAARVGVGDASRVLQVLEGHGSWLTRERRDRILVDSLANALAEIEKRLGSDPAQWQWGQLHQAVFEHPLAARADAATRAATHGRGVAARRIERHADGDVVPIDRLSARGRRLVPHGGGRRQLGRVGGDQHTGAVGRSGEPALSRPGAAVGRGALLPARLLAGGGGEIDADTVRIEPAPGVRLPITNLRTQGGTPL